MREVFNGNVETLRRRWENGRNIWTGVPLQGKDLEEWRLVKLLNEQDRKLKEVASKL